MHKGFIKRESHGSAIEIRCTKERIHKREGYTNERIHKNEGSGSTLSLFMCLGDHSPNPKPHENL
jgi:hypothetical protein